MQRRLRSALDLRPLESAQVLGIADENVASKLTTMGILPGSRLEMVRTGPFGGVFYVKADGRSFALREAELSQILVEL